MAKHQIRKSFWHKGYVWLFSYVEGNGIWSTHNTGDDHNMGGVHYAQRFQKEHDEQIDELHRQAVREEQLKLSNEGVTIDDRTEESRQILKQRN